METWTAYQRLIHRLSAVSRACLWNNRLLYQRQIVIHYLLNLCLAEGEST